MSPSSVWALPSWPPSRCPSCWWGPRAPSLSTHRPSCFSPGREPPPWGREDCGPGFCVAHSVSRAPPSPHPAHRSSSEAREEKTCVTRGHRGKRVLAGVPGVPALTPRPRVGTGLRLRASCAQAELGGEGPVVVTGSCGSVLRRRAGSLRRLLRCAPACLGTAAAPSGAGEGC